jgi:hypothetical protein
MVALLEPRCAPVATLMLAVACATYEPSLLNTAAGSAGASAGSAGALASGGAEAGTAGNAGSGGSGGETAGMAGVTTTIAGGGQASSETLPYVTAKLDVPSGSVDLTVEGTLDWAQWGSSAVSDYTHKLGVVSQLLDFKPTGSVAAQRYLAGPSTFTWSDGTPNASGSTSNGLTWQGIGEGFQLVVPVTGEARRLRLYVGVVAGTGVLKAAFSDTRVKTPLLQRISSDQAASQVVSVEYGNADKPNTTLNVSFRVESAATAAAAVSFSAYSVATP